MRNTVKGKTLTYITDIPDYTKTFGRASLYFFMIKNSDTELILKMF